MHRVARGLCAAALVTLGLLSAPRTVQAQAHSAAGRPFETSVFGGLTRTSTHLSGGDNIALTATEDFAFPQGFGFVPVIEIRGTYPISPGTIVAEKSAMGGLRLDRYMRSGARVYGDVLFGRGDMQYQNGGFAVPAADASTTLIYQQTWSNILSPGAGVEIPFGPCLYLRTDAQLQRWNTPAAASGHIYSVPLTFGIGYRLPYLKHGHPYP